MQKNERVIIGRPRTIADRIRKSVLNLKRSQRESRPGNWPVSPIIKPENVGQIVRYKAQLARQCTEQGVPENVRIGIEALRQAAAAGIDIGPINERLGL